MDERGVGTEDGRGTTEEERGMNNHPEGSAPRAHLHLILVRPDRVKAGPPSVDFAPYCPGPGLSFLIAPPDLPLMV